MGKFVDLTGMKFGRLTVIERDNSKDVKYGACWVCKCECGNYKTIAAHSLKNGSIQSCGCLNKEIISRPKDLSYMIGKKFGNLTVIQRTENHITPSGQKKAMFICKCDCGNYKTVSSQSLKTGRTKSCGCLPTKTRGSGLFDLTGKRFGKLVVIERAEDYKYITKNKETMQPRWLCKCDCGNITIAQGGNLRNGNTTNCGCERRKSKSETIITEFLTENKINYFPEFSFDDLRNKRGNLLRFDFAILDENNNVSMLIEYQGEQHYKDCGKFGLYQRKYSDKMKREYCNLHKIPLYEIRFDENLEDKLKNLLLKYV